MLYPFGNPSPILFYIRVEAPLTCLLILIQADVIVNTTGEDVNLAAGTVSYSILEAGGKTIQDELTKLCPSGLKIGQIAQTKGGSLHCQALLHVVLKQWINVNDSAEKV